MLDAVAKPNLPDEDGSIIVKYSTVAESAHRLGRALHTVGDENFTATVRTEVAAKIAAWCFHDKAGPDVEAFVAHHARAISAGNSGRCVADLRHEAKTAARSDDKVAGARWSLKGAEAVLTVRAVISNGDFDAYWAFHLRAEHQRIHQVRYQYQLGLAV